MITLQRDQRIREEGRAEGREEGALDTLSSLVADGLLSLPDAASRAGLSEEEFKERTAGGKTSGR